MKKTFTPRMLLFWASLVALGAVYGDLVGAAAVAFHEAIRTPFYAGLFALVPILLTYRATWLPKLKEAYDGPDHIANVKELRALGKKVAFVGGFDRLSDALATLTVLSALSGISQLVVAAYLRAWTAGACLGMGAACYVLLIYLMIRVRRIEKLWIRKLESEAEAKHLDDAPPATAKPT